VSGICTQRIGAAPSFLILSTDHCSSHRTLLPAGQDLGWSPHAPQRCLHRALALTLAQANSDRARCRIFRRSWCLAFANFIHNIRRSIVQPLVRSLSVVKREVSRQSRVQLAHRGITVQVHVLVSDVASQALNEDVVQRMVTAVHADVNAFTLRHPGERCACELAVLVGVEDLGLAAITQCLNVSARKSPQNDASMLLLIRQVSTRREYQSMIATR
jgi:hypothetical protein